MISTLIWTTVALAGVVTGQTAVDLDAVYAPRRVALLVGVQDYRDPALAGLRFAAKDAQDFARILGDPDLGGFDRVRVLSQGGETSGEGIHQALLDVTADLQRDDTFLLYLSGHGTLTVDPLEGSRLFFLPSDGELDRAEKTGIALADLEKALTALPARRRVLIADTCHNGRSGSKSALDASTRETVNTMRGVPPAPRNLHDVAESEARLYAAEYHQPAMEDPHLENGVYTHFLLRSLTDQQAAADLDRDGLVDIAEAHQYARDNTIEHTGGAQVPRAEYRIVGREEIFLSGEASSRSTAEKALLSALDDVLAQARVLVDGTPRGELPGLLAVEPGRHRVEVQTEDGRLIARQTVRLDPGTTMAIESLVGPQEPTWLLWGGTTARHGAGSATMHPWAAELEAGRFDLLDVGATTSWDLHLRGSWMQGTIPEQGDVSVAAGEVSLGLTFSSRLGPVHAGPLVEAMVPWRHFENVTGLHRQATLTGAAGLRAWMWLPTGERRVALRYDLRFAPYAHDASWTSLWHHGVAVGLRPRS
ncbi:MAG: caspase family protein [Myxococcota bacterium]|jgi:hypothetical protein|nr:caspase family protein [Myxococcota bacterium]